jgi:hypothetical protein
VATGPHPRREGRHDDSDLWAFCVNGDFVLPMLTAYIRADDGGRCSAWDRWCVSALPLLPPRFGQREWARSCTRLRKEMTDDPHD